MTQKFRTTLYIDARLWDELKKNAEETGLSVNQICVASISEYIREKKLHHYNVYENHVTIWDGNIEDLVDVYIVPREGNHVELHCSADLSTHCIHCDFAKKVPKFINMINEKGLKVVD